MFVSSFFFDVSEALCPFVFLVGYEGDSGDGVFFVGSSGARREGDFCSTTKSTKGFVQTTSLRFVVAWRVEMVHKTDRR